MITEREVVKAIEECMREPITGSKRSTLADLIIIQNYLFGEPSEESQPVQAPPIFYSSASAKEPTEKTIKTDGGSEFLDAIDGRKADRVWSLVDELVEAVKILHPRMYSTFIDKVQSL